MRRYDFYNLFRTSVTGIIDAMSRLNAKHLESSKMFPCNISIVNHRSSSTQCIVNSNRSKDDVKTSLIDGLNECNQYKRFKLNLTSATDPPNYTHYSKTSIRQTKHNKNINGTHTHSSLCKREELIKELETKKIVVILGNFRTLDREVLANYLRLFCQPKYAVNLYLQYVVSIDSCLLHTN